MACVGCGFAPWPIDSPGLAKALSPRQSACSAPLAIKPCDTLNYPVQS
jgi:hypothetical protein